MGIRNLALLASALSGLACVQANAQITAGKSTGSPFHGVPPSVTSFNFGGQSGFHGVPASVTSLGFGNPGFRLNQPFRSNRGFGGHRRGFGFSRSPFFGDIVAVPYAYPMYVMEPGVDDSMEEEEYRGGPTIFDRRGPGEDYYRPRARDEEDYRRSTDSDSARQKSRVDEPLADQPRSEQPVEPQPPTVLVFKDGHQSQVLNYAIVGDSLFELSNGRSIKIALAELDVPATQKENDQRGVGFTVPAAKAN
jgi:hypothetical protein